MSPLELAEFLPESMVKRAWELYLDHDLTPQQLIDEYEEMLEPHMDSINRHLPKPTTAYVMATVMRQLFTEHSSKKERGH